MKRLISCWTWLAEVDPKADVGLEIESENSALNRLGPVGPVQRGVLAELARVGQEDAPQKGGASWWQVKVDGSLRGAHPLEAVSRPLPREAVPAALEEYEAAAQRASYPYRAGTHVHLNLQQMPVKNVAGLIPMSLLADNFFFALESEARRGNYNCRPQSLLLQQIPLLAQMATKLHAEKVYKNDPFEGLAMERYTAMNWLALSKFGTVELRHFMGTRNRRQLLLWVDAALEMRNTMALPLDEAQAIFEEMYYGGYVPTEEFLGRFFPQHGRAMAYEGMDDDFGLALERVDQFFNYLDLYKRPNAGLNYALTRKWRM